MTLFRPPLQGGIVSAYHRWTRCLDQDDRVKNLTPVAWLATGASVTALLAAIAWLPGVEALFNLPIWAGLLLFLPAFLHGLSGTAWDRARGWSLSAYGLNALISCSLLQLFISGTMALSSMPGAAVLAGLYLLASAYHGHFLRASLTYPFGLLPTLVSSFVVAELGPEENTSVLLLVVFVAGVAALMIGTFALQVVELGKHRDQIRHALDASLLQERTDALGRVSDVVLQLRSQNHDAGNALSGVFMNAQMLEESIARMNGEPGVNRLKEISCDLMMGLAALKGMLHSARQIGQASDRELQPVDMSQLCAHVVRVTQQAFVGIRITHHAGGEVMAMLNGGLTTAERIVTNLLVNACQGDGVKAATLVELSLTESRSEVTLEIRDDGPGFPRRMLDAALVPLSTTKTGGSGLGLYTAMKLVAASEGQLTIANLPDRGAQVCVTLPRPSGGRESHERWSFAARDLPFHQHAGAAPNVHYSDVPISGTRDVAEAADAKLDLEDGHRDRGTG